MMTALDGGMLGLQSPLHWESHLDSRPYFVYILVSGWSDEALSYLGPKDHVITLWHSPWN